MNIGPVGFSIPVTTLGSVDLPGKRVAQLPQDIEWKELADFQLDLARSVDVTLVSDYYHGKRAPTSAQIKKLGNDWPAVFHNVTVPVHYDLWKHQGVLVFRSHQWFYDDKFEVPARVQARLVQSDRKRGYLSFDELSDAGILNDRQLKYLSAVLPVAGELRNLRPVFRWYRKLPLLTKRQVVYKSDCLVARTDYRDLPDDEGELVPSVRGFGPIESMRIAVATVRTKGHVRYDVIVRNGKSWSQLPIEQEINFDRRPEPAPSP